jgi:hypothetical protein
LNYFAKQFAATDKENELEGKNRAQTDTGYGSTNIPTPASNDNGAYKVTPAPESGVRKNEMNKEINT